MFQFVFPFEECFPQILLSSRQLLLLFIVFGGLSEAEDIFGSPDDDEDFLFCKKAKRKNILLQMGFPQTETKLVKFFFLKKNTSQEVSRRIR